MTPRVHSSGRGALTWLSRLAHSAPGCRQKRNHRVNHASFPVTDACFHGKALSSGAVSAQQQAASAAQDGHLISADPPSASPEAGVPTKSALRKRDPHWRSDRWLRNSQRGLKLDSVINTRDICPSTTPVSSAPEAQVLCTYNWRNVVSPHIYVPGTAPTWKDLPLPITLPRDSGTFFIDQNFARVAQHPLEPIFRAVAATDPGFRFDDVDIVADRNTFRRLHEFCSSQSHKIFRLKLTLVKNSLLIERWERTPWERNKGIRPSGYGRNFEMAFTNYPPRFRDSTSHHRVLLYQLGPLRCAVRCEVDARYNGPSDASPEAQAAVSQGRPQHKLIYGPSSASTTTKVTRTSPDAAMPQSTVAEMKTAGRQTPSCLAQLWFGRTPWLIIGRHVDGTLGRVRITDVAARFAAWEERNQNSLRKLVTGLMRLRDAVRRSGGKSCIATCERQTAPRTIKIFAASGKATALPDDLIARFWT